MERVVINSTHVEKALANLPQLVFEVTDTCNLKCSYCGYGEFYEDYDNREGKMLPTEKAIRLIDYLSELWNSYKNVSYKHTMYVSFYGGEPLLNMPFIKTIVDYIENKLECVCREFEYTMTTNAMLLNKYMDYLKEYNFRLLISLDGNKNNTAYRVNKSGNPAFDRIIENVDILRKKYPDYFNEKVNFNAVLHNKNSVEEIYNFFKEKYNKVPTIGELNNVGIREDKRKEFMQAYRNKQENLQQAEHYEEIEREMFMNTASYQSALVFLHQYSGFLYKDYRDLLFDRSRKKTVVTGTCLPFTKKMFITVNGKILPCERIGHQFALGEITDTEIILDNHAIADKYNAYYAKMQKQCNKCKNIKTCTQCLFNLEDVDNNPICKGFMNDEMFNRYVNTQMDFLAKNPEAYNRLMTEVVTL